jgi:SHS2 domain-containing protein
MSEGFRHFEHTGDLGLEVWAETPERLYALAAEALCAQIAEALPGPAELRRTMELEGDDPAELLVHWLNTVLLEAELARAVWTRVEVRSLERARLSATLEGQRLDPRRQVLLREVKAVSHHHLELDLEHRPCTCRLVLDL